MKRRSFLRVLGATYLATFGGLSGCGGGGSDGFSSSEGGTFVLLSGQPLVVPPLYEGVLDNTGTRVYKLSIEERTAQFYSGVNTQTWAINAPGGTQGFLGPTLKLVNGESVSIRYTNRLTETTTMHGHGMHVPAAMDGGPHQKIAPNATWAAEYTVNQPACTAWYHPHEVGKTAEQVYKGLAGMMIVEDSNSQALDLPNTYGEDDIPLVLQDRVFDSGGKLDYSPSTMEVMRGYRGDVWLANGQARPYFDAKEGLLRLRLLNGSNAGIYQLSLSNGDRFSLIATDNGFVASPVSLDRIVLTPGERAEIVLDLTGKAGQTLSLQVNELFSNVSGTFLDIRVGTAPANVTSLPSTLATLSLPQADDAVRTRTFSLDMLGPGRLGINGQSMDMNRIDQQVPVGELEIWEITNRMPIPHNFHIHATHFVPLDRNGSVANLKAWERDCYKDTIYVPANATVRFLTKMADYTDSANPYMFHCHILEHEDAGMMGQFVVV